MNVRILTSTYKASLAFTEKASVPPNCVLSTEHNSLICSCDFTYVTPSSFFFYFCFCFFFVDGGGDGVLL